MCNRNTYQAKKINTQSTIPEASHETDQPATENSMISQKEDIPNEVASPLKSSTKEMKHRKVEEHGEDQSTLSN